MEDSREGGWLPVGPRGRGFRVARDLRDVVSLGVVFAEPFRVGPSAGELVEEMGRAEREAATRYAGRNPGQILELAPARKLYRSFGVDPTRTRPSSESLLRRVLRGKPLPRILNAVDVCNVCSLRSLLPMGLYDAGKIAGEVTLRRGGPGESYPGIRKDRVNLEGRPVLVDREGPFGNPTSDSLRTSVTPSTRALWMVIFAPASYPADRLRHHTATTATTLRRGQTFQTLQFAVVRSGQVELLE